MTGQPRLRRGLVEQWRAEGGVQGPLRSADMRACPFRTLGQRTAVPDHAPRGLGPDPPRQEGHQLVEPAFHRNFSLVGRTAWVFRFYPTTPTAERPCSAPSPDSRFPTDDREPHLRPALPEPAR